MDEQAKSYLSNLLTLIMIYDNGLEALQSVKIMIEAKYNSLQAQKHIIEEKKQKVEKKEMDMKDIMLDIPNIKEQMVKNMQPIFDITNGAKQLLEKCQALVLPNEQPQFEIPYDEEEKQIKVPDKVAKLIKSIKESSKATLRVDSKGKSVEYIFRHMY